MHNISGLHSRFWFLHWCRNRVFRAISVGGPASPGVCGRIALRSETLERPAAACADCHINGAPKGTLIVNRHRFPALYRTTILMNPCLPVVMVLRSHNGHEHALFCGIPDRKSSADVAAAVDHQRETLGAAGGGGMVKCREKTLKKSTF